MYLLLGIVCGIALVGRWAWSWLLSAADETARERYRLTDGYILREIER